MKYFLVCFLLIVSCKSAITDTGNPNVMVGTARNQKTGATLSTESGVCMIAGLRSWDSIYVGKKVKVRGNFKFTNWETDRRKFDNPVLNSLQAQTYPKYYIVTDATWELYDAD